VATTSKKKQGSTGFADKTKKKRKGEQMKMMENKSGSDYWEESSKDVSGEQKKFILQDLKSDQRSGKGETRKGYVGRGVTFKKTRFTTRVRRPVQLKGHSEPKNLRLKP